MCSKTILMLTLSLQSVVFTNGGGLFRRSLSTSKQKIQSQVSKKKLLNSQKRASHKSKQSRNQDPFIFFTFQKRGALVLRKSLVNVSDSNQNRQMTNVIETHLSISLKSYARVQAGMFRFGTSTQILTLTRPHFALYVILWTGLYRNTKCSIKFLRIIRQSI